MQYQAALLLLLVTASATARPAQVSFILCLSEMSTTHYRWLFFLQTGLESSIAVSGLNWPAHSAVQRNSGIKEGVGSGNDFVNVMVIVTRVAGGVAWESNHTRYPHSTHHHRSATNQMYCDTCCMDPGLTYILTLLLFT